MAVADNLAIDSSGKVTKVFGVQTASSGFILNGEPLTMDKAASTKLLNGDTLQFFTGVTEDGQEQGLSLIHI